MNSRLRISLLLLILLHFLSNNVLITTIQAQKRLLFREYIGAEDKNVKFSDLPINSNVDYTNDTKSPSPTNGDFRVYWDSDNLSPSQVSAIKSKNSNVKVAMSLGGDTVTKNNNAYFTPTSVNSWVSNAISSITKIVSDYNLDGIDIDYEHFRTDPDTFAECIGRLLFYLKQNKIVSFASIAPYENDSVQPYYLALCCLVKSSIHWAQNPCKVPLNHHEPQYLIQPASCSHSVLTSMADPARQALRPFIMELEASMEGINNLLAPMRSTINKINIHFERVENQEDPDDDGIHLLIPELVNLVNHPPDNVQVGKAAAERVAAFPTLTREALRNNHISVRKKRNYP